MFPETCYLQGSKKDYDEFNGENKDNSQRNEDN